MNFPSSPFSFSLSQILILRHGQLASNVSVEYPVHSKMMSNLEPHHLYHLQIAAMNSQGLIGPFSTILQVKYELATIMIRMFCKCQK